MDLRHEDSLQAICCQVVRYPHVKTLSLSVPKDALVGEVTRFVKQEFPSDYKDVSAARTKVLALLKGGRYMPLGGLMESRLPARICDFGLGFVQDLLREDSRELSLNGKIADQLPPPTNEKGVIYLAALVPCKLLACLIIGGFEEDDDFFYHGIHEGWTMRDFKIYLMKTQPVPADFKLVLATDGDQSLLCEEVVVEERNERVTTVMNALAAQEEIDLSRTVRSVFGDDSSLSCVDVLIVEQDGILGKRKDRPVRGGVLLQSVRALPPLRGLLHVMKQISDFVINIPDTIDLAAREGWARVVRAHGETLPCSLDAMDDAAARGHLEVVKWLHEHHPEWNTRYGLADAVVNGHFEVVDWLIEYSRDWDFNWKHYERFDCSEIMLKHLEEKRKSYPITCPIVEAAAAGWLDEIERLHCNVSAYKIKFAMAEAARHNQVEVVTYLIKRYKTYSTRLAVETAAAVGHTKILDLLLWNKSEDLVIATVESAARYGRMDVLRYLGSYGVYKEGEHERQLYDRMKELYRASDALGEAARAGQREAVRWILDEEKLAMYRSYVDSSIFVIERAVRDNQHDVVELVCSCCSKDEVYSTLHRGVSLRCGLNAIKAIYNACPPEKLAGAAKELLAKFNPCDEETVKFLRSVEHI